MALDSPAPALLRVELIPPAQAGAALGNDRLLALIGFGDTRPAVQQASPDPRVGWVPLAELDISEPTYEAWFGAATVTSTEFLDIALSHNGTVAFGRLQVDEDADGGLEAATTAAYDRILASMQALGYPHLLRIWHVLAGINEVCGPLDRYKVFCRGRHEALAPLLAGREIRLPAASAVGGRQPGLMIQFLACRSPGQQIENPRQVSAFRYPPEYGPRSPAFSRATLVRCGGSGSVLLISGTASIVGHRTWHVDDVPAQFAETVNNIDAVLAAAAAELGAPLRLEAVRVYLRPPQSAPQVRALLAQHFGRDVPAVVLAADICRPDLLLEIEGVARAEGA